MSHDSGIKRHSAYRSLFIVIEYPWHPLNGERVKLFRRTGRRGKEVIHVEARDGISRELPLWMADAAVCAAMSKGSVQVSIEALIELREVLSAQSHRLPLNASLGPSQQEGNPDEATDEPPENPGGVPPRAGAETTAGGRHTQGTDRGPGGCTSGGLRRGGGNQKRHTMLYETRAPSFRQQRMLSSA